MKTAWRILVGISCLGLLGLGVWHGSHGDYAQACYCLLLTVVMRQKGL